MEFKYCSLPFYSVIPLKSAKTQKYNAPKNIDYLSIDTEGTEFEILSNFDFSKHSFHVITCEHNYTPICQRIFKLLSNNGYVRQYEELSKWDDWYVHDQDSKTSLLSGIRK